MPIILCHDLYHHLLYHYLIYDHHTLTSSAMISNTISSQGRIKVARGPRHFFSAGPLYNTSTVTYCMISLAVYDDMSQLYITANIYHYMIYWDFINNVYIWYPECIVIGKKRYPCLAGKFSNCAICAEQKSAQSERAGPPESAGPPAYAGSAMGLIRPWDTCLGNVAYLPDRVDEIFEISYTY